MKPNNEMFNYMSVYALNIIKKNKALTKHKKTSSTKDF